MRENMGLFRGKRIDNGEWVEGYYLYRGEEYSKIGIDVHYILTHNMCGFSWHEVDPSTIGECTGLKDKNGKKIFERDIVWFIWVGKTMNFRIDFVSGEFLAVPVKQQEDVWAIRISGQGKDFEVIGNIHDNPELLEEAK